MNNQPLLTPEAIAFLSNFLMHNPQANILEFGSGGSTLWFAQQKADVITIEHDIRWYTQVAQELALLPEHTVDLRFVKRTYWKVCEEFPDNYVDLVLIDGRDRVACAQEAMRIIKPGGVLMLDNAERANYASIYAMLSAWQLHTSEYKRLSMFQQNSMHNVQTNWWIKPL